MASTTHVKSADAMADHYDSLAAEWDRTMGPLGQNPVFAGQFGREIGALLGPVRGASEALELGAGTGAYVELTAPLFTHLTAGDLSEGMLDVFRARLSNRNIGNVSLRRLDALDLREIADSSMDVVYSFGLLENIPDFERCFSECRRVLKPGGSMLGITSNGDCPWYALRWRLQGGSQHCRRQDLLKASTLRSLLPNLGFEIVRSRCWGAVSPGFASIAVAHVLHGAGRLVERTPASRWLGVLSFSARKPVA